MIISFYKLNWEDISLVGITIYFVLTVLILAILILSNQFKHASFNKQTFGFGNEFEDTSSLFETTVIRLMICWIYSISIAFLAFSRLQCGTDEILTPEMCSVALQIFFAIEMHLIVAEQFLHRYSIMGETRNICKHVLLKFTAFSIVLPTAMILLMFCILGKTGFVPVASESLVVHDNNSQMTCWIEWNATSVQISSSIAGIVAIISSVIALMNVANLLRMELRGIQVSFRCWWGIATRIVFMVITIAKWASIVFHTSCPGNVYNTIATIFVSPILMAIMFTRSKTCSRKRRNNVSAIRLRRRLADDVELDVIELSEPQETEPMLQHDVINGDVTRHVTHGNIGLYTVQNTIGNGHPMMMHRHNGISGENALSCDFHDEAASKTYFTKGNGERQSAEVDDGVISNDGDYDNHRQNYDAFDVEAEVAMKGGCEVGKSKSEGPRLSHAESTDSGMGFSDNVKDADNSRLSDGYGTIHIIETKEEPHNRKSLIDGDAEYDEVMEFISTPTEANIDIQNTIMEEDDMNTSTTSNEPNSKYAELDLAKILHTRRRHKKIMTSAKKPPQEEKPPEESMFNSLKRKTKSKNYSFSNYATYAPRGRKASKQISTDSWASRPSSTCNEGDDILSPLSDRISQSTSLDRRSNYTIVDIPYGPNQSSTLNTRRSHLTSDLMMTSDVNDEVITPTATLDRSMSWRNDPKSPPIDTEDLNTNIGNMSNRWSWLSNSSHDQSQSNDKTPTSSPSKSPWKIFRRLLGGGETKDTNLTRSRSTSIFRRFSTKKSHKSNSFNKRRSSVPSKSEWDVQLHDEEVSNLDTSVPVLDAGKQKPVAPKGITTQKPRNRLSTRLMSFRGGKGKHSKQSKSDPMSKGLSISSPQLALNAIDPTRNYCEHQLLNLDDMKISSDKR
ncbi:uncharacterized protein LOC120346430 [Styela clava]